MSSGTKKVLVALSILVVLGAWFWYRAIRVHGFIVAMEPVDATHAIVCLRANKEFGYGPRGWIALVDDHGNYQWWERLPAPCAGGQRNGLLVHEGMVVVRTRQDAVVARDGETTARRASDGALLWSVPFSSGYAATYFDLGGRGKSVLQGTEKGQGWMLQSLAASTGKVEWEQKFDNASSTAVRLAGETLVLEHVFPPRTPPPLPSTIHGSGSGCIENGEYVFVEDADFTHPTRVIARRLDAEAVRVVASPIPLPEGSFFDRILACGTYAGRIVFTARFRAQTEPTQWVGIVTVDPKGAEPTSVTKVLEGLDAWMMSLGTSPFPEHEPLMGALPRFVPLFRRAESKTALAVLDLEERKIVREGPASSAYGRLAYKHGDGFLLVEGGEEAWTLARLDGKTGMLTAAVALEVTVRVAPPHIRAGRIWIHRSRWVDGLPFVVLDADSLNTVASSGGEVVAKKGEDVLAVAQASWLGPTVAK